ncbi:MULTISPECIES: TIGR03758 family integrating conjugative element protein [Acetobacteraceae]|uniref:TIGR03758 family integrating conjugative element protein n=1 Tax=Komagataeibacter rhaeticus TaxID=215221 RepID=A0A858JCT6_9PROT|nr:TIGR03758 family integrating conjugative element protein [Komagataeibacter rhaeticus]QIP34471.1 TIGR03758 family integrating conjugative element protein [Komagataeibacter rhaeticus]QOC46988.1 TIGR03758 family integrating conjugative element protein [Komagataeibacter rhaeticus]
MTLSSDQSTAFQANAGFTPASVSTAATGMVFAVLLLWGAWATHAAWAGWAGRKLTERQFLGVITRFVAMYLALGVLLLS